MMSLLIKLYPTPLLPPQVSRSQLINPDAPEQVGTGQQGATPHTLVATPINM